MSLLAQYQHETWPSPAKLNLFLHITNQRADGYHELQSLFQMLDYGDTLTFAPASSSNITLSPAIPGVALSDNLVYRAAHLLQTHANVQTGVHITLEKRLPMGGGLGGGSTNAATTLLVLNQLWQCGLCNSQLCQLGLQLGADVPVFINGLTTFAEGVGERFIPVPEAQQSGAYYLVVHPGEHVSTGTVFTHPDLPRNTPKMAFSDYTFAKTQNDCQELVVNLYPKVAKLLQHLLHYVPSRMTGTGACIFAIFDTETDAQVALETLLHEQILDTNATAFIGQGVATSPLRTKIKSIFGVWDKD